MNRSREGGRWRRRAGWRGRGGGGRLLPALLATAVLLPVGCAGWLYVSLPDAGRLADEWPESTAYMELRRRQARAEDRRLTIRYEPVPMGRIPDQLQRAVRVAEDATFYTHGGVDWYELRMALREAWSEEDERLRGASTITMQLARNLYLSPDRDFLRKLREVAIAFRLERQLSKRRIFELYLNVVELGRGVFGVEAAARHYYGIPVSAVDRRQAAELAATLPAPRTHNPGTRTRRFRWRTKLIHRRAFDTELPPRGATPTSPPALRPAAPPGAGRRAPTSPSASAPSAG